MKTTSSEEIIAIVGPTASGKTEYSVKLAKELNGEIISADSRLVYKGFDIGTAKPTLEEQSGIVHHMIDIVEPEFEYTAGLYKQQAQEIITDILARGKTPIVVGGTGLYIDILLKNYELPMIEPNKDLRNELTNLENNELYKILLKFDKNAQNYIDINDKKKIIRAVEILITTGKTLAESRGIGSSQYNIKWIGKNFERETLYNRINKRVDIMIEKGLIDETKCLLKKHGRIPNLTDTIGYREMLMYLDKECSLEQAKELLKQNTRRYAKRQLTWFRKNPDIEWDIYPEKLNR